MIKEIYLCNCCGYRINQQYRDEPVNDGTVRQRRWAGVAYVEDGEVANLCINCTEVMDYLVTEGLVTPQEDFKDNEWEDVIDDE